MKMKNELFDSMHDNVQQELFTDRHYKELVIAIRAQIHVAKQDLNRLPVMTYWRIGELINHYLKHGQTSSPAAPLVRRLDGDVDLDFRTLQHSLQFYRCYPVVDESLPISWSHYRYLLTLKTDIERRIWERRIVRDQFNSKIFLELLNKEPLALQPVPDAKMMESRRGSLFHYRCIQLDDIHTGLNRVFLDLGFGIYLPPPLTKAQLSNKRIVRSEQREGLNQLVVTNTKHDRLYTYVARVERIVSGHKLRMAIDCGFGVWTRQLIRLNGVLASDSDSRIGQAVMDALAGELKRCPFVVIKVERSLSSGKFFGEIFYKPGEFDVQAIADQGRSLNRFLLKVGVARPSPPIGR
jgi:hypothetical protein